MPEILLCKAFGNDDVTFHTLRHTFSSWAMMRGVAFKELQELLGHSSLAMTMRYAHLAQEHLRTAVSRLEGLTSIEPTKVLAQELAQEPVETEGASQKYLKYLAPRAGLEPATS